MSLIKFIQKLQRKPRYVRVQILWLSVFVSMFFIVSLWVVSLKYSNSSDKTAGRKEGISEELQTKISPIKESFKASIGSFFDLFGKGDKEENKNEPVSQEVKKEEIEPAKLPLR